MVFDEGSRGRGSRDEGSRGRGDGTWGEGARASKFILVVTATISAVLTLFFVLNMTARLLGSDGKVTDSASKPKSPKVDYQGFDKNMIVPDSAIYGAGAMSEQQIRQFIASVNEGCREGATKTACLKDMRVDLAARKADQYCSGQLAAVKNADAATAIWRAATACDINPKALLVMLQKEQGLLTASGSYLTPRRYEAAMGYFCPDNAPCNPNFKGFDQQVYYAAKQLQRYRIKPGDYGYRAGRTDKIKYSPDAACGVTSVTPANVATAALYNYTPYPPMPQTLKGNPSDCESWGNLNFYGLYKAWFGLPKQRGS